MSEQQVALITGAAQGLGRVLTEAFLGQGWAVVATDIDAERLERSASGGPRDGLLALPLDIASERDVQRRVRQAAEWRGRVDALVNNAALLTTLQRKPLLETSLQEWDHVLHVNLTGAFLMTKAVGAVMSQLRRGSIINISSVAIYTCNNNLGHYNVSKAGLVALTRTAARELGVFGIRVNAVAPGATATENVSRISGPDRLERKAGERCLKRIEQPEDIVGSVLFLASEASAFITGQLLNVDGGEVLR